MMSDHEDLRIQLESISEQIGDRIFTMLREAVAAGADGRPPAEKVLSRARSAVDKAAHLLATLEED
jgi:hypothetical protein